MLQFSPEDVQRIRQRVQARPAYLETMRQRCAHLLTWGVKVPRGTQSTWAMYFECPVDSSRLTYDYTREDDYVCPACGAHYHGEPYSGAWWRYTVDMTVSGGYQAALVWMITGEKPYLDCAVEVLRRFAENYPTYELHGGIPYNHPGKISSQTLCEALTLSTLCTIFDLVREELPESLERQIMTDLLAPSAQVLREQRMNQIHNHEVIINGALAMAALLLNSRDDLFFAVESKYGLRYQLTHGVLEDGLWFEGTLHYHYFVLNAFMLFEKFAHGTPYSMMNMGIYEKMYAMPLQLLQPDYHMPCLGDVNGEGMFLELAEHYEYPYRMMKRPEMAVLLNEVYRHKARDGYQALLFGAEEIEPMPPMLLKDYHNDDQSGLTVLRGSEGKYLLFKHGRFGGEHDHYDKLGIHLMAADVDVVDDLGTVGYAAPHHYPYFKNTFTHNTVCINGVNQPPCDGRTVQYERRADGVLVEGHADWCGAPPVLDSFVIRQWDEEAYRGVTMRRAILFTDAYFVEAFLVRGAADRTVDWVIHPRGEAKLPEKPAVQAHVGDSAPQRFLHDAVAVDNSGVTVTCWTQDAGSLRVFSACTRPGRILYATGPANPTTENLRYMIHRVEHAPEEVVYMNVFTFGRQGQGVQSVNFSYDGCGQITACVMLDGQARVHRFSIGL